MLIEDPLNEPDKLCIIMTSSPSKKITFYKKNLKKDGKNFMVDLMGLSKPPGTEPGWETISATVGITSPKNIRNS